MDQSRFRRLDLIALDRRDYGAVQRYFQNATRDWDLAFVGLGTTDLVVFGAVAAEVPFEDEASVLSELGLEPGVVGQRGDTRSYTTNLTPIDGFEPIGVPAAYSTLILVRGAAGGLEHVLRKAPRGSIFGAWGSTGYYTGVILAKKGLKGAPLPLILHLRDKGYHTFSVPIIQAETVMGAATRGPKVPIHMLASTDPGFEPEAVAQVSTLVNRKADSLFWSHGSKDLLHDRIVRVDVVRYVRQLWGMVTGTETAISSTRTYVASRVAAVPAHRREPRVRAPRENVNPFAVHDVAGGLDWSAKMETARRVVDALLPAYNQAVQHLNGAVGGASALRVVSPHHREPANPASPVAYLSLRAIRGSEGAQTEPRAIKKGEFDLTILLSSHVLAGMRDERAPAPVHEVTCALVHCLIHTLNFHVSVGGKPADYGPDRARGQVQLWRHLGEITGTFVALSRLPPGPERLRAYARSVWGEMNLEPGHLARLVGARLIERMLDHPMSAIHGITLDAVREVYAAASDVRAGLGIADGPGVDYLNDQNVGLAAGILLGDWPMDDRYNEVALERFARIITGAWQTVLVFASYVLPSEAEPVGPGPQGPNGQDLARLLLAHDPAVGALVRDCARVWNSDSADALTAYLRALRALESAAGSPVRWRLDGTAVLPRCANFERLLVFAHEEGHVRALHRGTLVAVEPMPHPEHFWRVDAMGGAHHHGAELLCRFRDVPNGKFWRRSDREDPDKFPSIHEDYVGRPLWAKPQSMSATEQIRRTLMELAAVEAIKSFVDGLVPIETEAPLSFNVSPWLLDPKMNVASDWYREKLEALGTAIHAASRHRNYAPVIELVEGGTPRSGSPLGLHPGGRRPGGRRRGGRSVWPGYRHCTAAPVGDWLSKTQT